MSLKYSKGYIEIDEEKIPFGEDYRILIVDFLIGDC